MNNKYTFPALLLLTAIVVGIVIKLSGSNIALLDSAGEIALRERSLLFFATALMFVIGFVIYAFTLVIAWRYRAENTKARYTPNWEHSRFDEFVWWLVPSIVIFFLALITWTSSHALDPFRPLQSGAPTLTIQAVALPWKWLFIYREAGVASVNYVQLPALTPIKFEITGDAPMNSFWIPRLGGQIYAMTGMKSQLHLIADKTGDYEGSSANYSGSGFSGMRFVARVTSAEDFSSWAQSLSTSSYPALTMEAYDALARPSENTPVSYYSSVEKGLYTRTIGKFMGHSR